MPTARPYPTQFSFLMAVLMSQATGLAVNPTPDDPRKKKIAADCFRRGNEAIPKENWDYAIQMYGQSVTLVPDNLMFRQSLRGAEQKKYGGNGSGARLGGMKLMGIRTKLKKEKFSKNWAVVAELAEEGLQVNPWDAQLNADLGEACTALGYQEVACFAYRESLKADPHNEEVNIAFANLMEERGEYEEATACWERVLKAKPNNGVARTKLTHLQAKKVMDRGGYEGATSTKNVMADHEVQKRLKLGQEVDGPGMSVEADLQRAIRKDPANKANYMKLADYYNREGNLEKAEELYQKALELTGGDVSVRELLEDVQLGRMKQALDIAKELAAKSTEPESKQRAGKMAMELLHREIEVFSARTERYPNDMRLKFELSKRLMRVQRWQAAIPLLQAARGDSRIKGDALLNLGKCFNYDGKQALARRQFEAAIPEIKMDEKPDAFKDLHYTLAKLCEELKDNAAAEDHYQKVLEVDYNYKDTLDRLNKLQGGGESAE